MRDAAEWGEGLAVGARVETPTGRRGVIEGGPRHEPDAGGYAWLVDFAGEDEPRWWMGYGLRRDPA